MAAFVLPAFRQVCSHFWGHSTRSLLGVGRNACCNSGSSCLIFQRWLCNVVEPDEVQPHQYVAEGASSVIGYRPGQEAMDESELKLPRKRPTSKVSLVNDMLAQGTTGRLFCVVYMNSRQYKVTKGDIIVTDKLACEPGAQIFLNKVLLVGASDFTLIGTPVLRQELVRVRATVIEHTKTTKVLSFKKKRRNRRKRRVGHRSFITLLRINDVTVAPKLEENPMVD